LALAPQPSCHATPLDCRSYAGAAYTTGIPGFKIFAPLVRLQNQKPSPEFTCCVS